MKTRYITFLGALLFLFGSCAPGAQEIDSIIPESGKLVKVTAYLDNTPQTKTGLVDKEDGGKSVVWKSGNSISVFYNSGTAGGSKFTTSTNGPIAEFLGDSPDLSGVGGQAYFWGLYPYNEIASCDGTAITTTLPANQLAYQGDVADDLLVTVGRSENLSIHFKNACSVIGFTLTQENINKVVFSGNAGEKVAGEFKISFDASNKLVDTPTENAVESITITPADATTFQTGVTYYFATLPGTFSEGYSLAFTKADASEAIYQQPSAVTLKASTFYTMGDKDEGLTFINNEFVSFEDANFKAYCVENFDTDGDGEISMAEALDVRSIKVCTDNIVSMKGLEFFTNLTDLTCEASFCALSSASNHERTGTLSDLDVSKNTKLEYLKCAGNILEQLDLSANIQLSYINCSINNLTKLDVSNNSALITINAPGNLLEGIDVSHNEILTRLDCGYNKISSLDVSSNTLLKVLVIADNTISSLSVSSNPKLETLDCSSNQIGSLILENNPDLKRLHCAGNQLTSLDLTHNPALVYMTCDSNRLGELTLPPSIESLWCNDNQLAALDVSMCLNLSWLWCSNNQLTSLNVSNNTELTKLWCFSNKLTSLDVSNNTALKVLSCGSNQLTSLDVSQNTALTSLDCTSNLLTSLDVSQNTALQTLYCRSNQLTSLDVSQNTALTTLWCGTNPLLTEIWLKTGQTIEQFSYDSNVATIKYK